MSEVLRLTVVIEDVGHAANVGGPVTRRTVSVPLTIEQSAALQLRSSWELHALAIIEAVTPPATTTTSEEEL